MMVQHCIPCILWWFYESPVSPVRCQRLRCCCHCRIVLDKETQKPKGFAFVEFFDIATAESAVRNMNNYEVNGRTIRVNFADDQPDRAGRGRGPGDFRGPPGAGPPMPEPPAAAKVRPPSSSPLLSSISKLFKRA